MQRVTVTKHPVHEVRQIRGAVVLRVQLEHPHLKLQHQHVLVEHLREPERSGEKQQTVRQQGDSGELHSNYADFYNHDSRVDSRGAGLAVL